MLIYYHHLSLKYKNYNTHFLINHRQKQETFFARLQILCITDIVDYTEDFILGNHKIGSNLPYSTNNIDFPILTIVAWKIIKPSYNFNLMPLNNPLYRLYRQFYRKINKSVKFGYITLHNRLYLLLHNPVCPEFASLSLIYKLWIFWMFCHIFKSDYSLLTEFDCIALDISKNHLSISF